MRAATMNAVSAGEASEVDTGARAIDGALVPPHAPACVGSGRPPFV
jgi:hypothetical protein